MEDELQQSPVVEDAASPVAEEATADVVEDTAAESANADTTAEEAKKKRQEASYKGRFEQERKLREQQAAELKAVQERLARVEAAAEAEQKAKAQRETEQDIEKTLAPLRRKMEDAGYDEAIITERLDAEARAIRNERTAKNAALHAARLEWTQGRAQMAQQVLGKLAQSVLDDDGLTVKPDLNEFLASLKVDVMDGPAAIAELHETGQAYISRLKKAARMQAAGEGRAKNAQAREAANPEAMATGETASRTPKQIWLAYGEDPSITTEDARKARAALQAQGVYV